MSKRNRMKSIKNCDSKNKTSRAAEILNIRLRIGNIDLKRKKKNYVKIKNLDHV